MNLIDYINEIEKLKKERSYDEAWRLANKGLIELRTHSSDMWFMMYYQMADILTKEKKWFEALEKMGFVIYYLDGLGGTSHDKFVRRLLKKFDAEEKIEDYVNISKSNNPRELAGKLRFLLGNKQRIVESPCKSA